jgi:hypothetical protein
MAVVEAESRPVELTNEKLIVAPGLSVAALTSVSQSGQPATGAKASGPATAVPMLVSTTAATTSPVVDRGGYRGPAALVIANIAGATPSETIDIQGSVDNVNWYNAAYALVATPNTVAVAQITVTTTATTTYLLLTDQAWRYLRVVTATITNETTWVTFYI